MVNFTSIVKKMSDELCEAEALRGHINCGNVKLNLDKLVFSLSCIYCDLEMLSIKDFGYHFQEHLVMNETENAMLLRNVERIGKSNALISVEVPLAKTHEDSTEKQTNYEIEMLEEETEEVNSKTTDSIENEEEHQFVYQMMGNDIATEFNHVQDESNNIGTQQQIEEPETVDIGFNLISDDFPAENDDKQNDDNLACDVCDFKFTDTDTLRKHRAHHNRCYICKMTFPSKVQLNAHLRTHKNKSIYGCGECNQTFSTTSELTTHLRSHQKKILHLCNTCGKSFQDENILRQHIKVHKKSRPYVCIECNMTFSKSHALMLHTKLHSDVRKFSCSICRMTFAQNSGLVNHLRDRHGNIVANEA